MHRTLVRSRNCGSLQFNLEFPYDIERDEVQVVRRVMSLQRSSKRSAGITVRAGPSIHQLPRGPSCYVMIDLVLDAGAVSQLPIERQDGVTIRCRDRRTVIRKSRRPEPFFTEPKLLPDCDMTRVREMQVGGDSPLVLSRDSDRELCERRPVLPSDITHQTPVGQDLVKAAQHHLLRLGQRDVHFYSGDSLANMAEKRAETRHVRAKAELVVFRRLISESDAKFRNRPEQHANLGAERFIPRLHREAPIRRAWRGIVNFRLKGETPDPKAETRSH